MLVHRERLHRLTRAGGSRCFDVDKWVGHVACASRRRADLVGALEKLESYNVSFVTRSSQEEDWWRLPDRSRS